MFIGWNRSTKDGKHCGQRTENLCLYFPLTWCPNFFAIWVGKKKKGLEHNTDGGELAVQEI